uniref:G-protein coupled receptors family 1 profile domain-containing protein n=1 Tax=Romanomermis culicivorax TaxID=13658 RepID=A0A915KQB7_ROMCU
MSNKRLKTHFYVIYGAYTFNGALCASGYIWKSILHAAFINDKSLSYMPWWLCHLLTDVLSFTECNYTCFIFAVSVERFAALVYPVNFRHITKKHALIAVLMQQIFVLTISSLGYINSEFYKDVSCLIVDFALSNLATYTTIFTFLLLIISITLYVYGYFVAKRRMNAIADRRLASRRDHLIELKNMGSLLKIILSFRVVGYLIGGALVYGSMNANLMPKFLTADRMAQYTSLFFALDKLCEPAYTTLKLKWARNFCKSLLRGHHEPKGGESRAGTNSEKLWSKPAENGRVSPLANVGVCVTISTRAQQKSSLSFNKSGCLLEISRGHNYIPKNSVFLVAWLAQLMNTLVARSRVRAPDRVNCYWQQILHGRQ